MTIIRTFQLKRGTAAEWAAANPILRDGVVGLEKDTRQLKFGDGVTAWNMLDYGTVAFSDSLRLLGYLDPEAETVPYFSDAGSMALVPFRAFGRELAGAVDLPAALALLDLDGLEARLTSIEARLDALESP